jgi:hypothetical protein
MHRLPKPSPAIAIALAALFFALGGTAFAVNQKAAPAQPRCAPGAIKAIAVLNSGQFGLDTLPNSYTDNSEWFTYRWSCTGGTISVRKPPDVRGIEVYFGGNNANAAIVSANVNGVPNAGSVYRAPDGGYIVSMGGSNQGAPGPWEFQNNIPFTIVLM